MPQNAIGQTKIQIPVSKAVGAQHSAPPGVAGGSAAPSVSVPGPTPLIINGRATGNIDVRTMTSDQMVAVINTAGIPGVTASIDGSGRLNITGINTLEGDGNLRAILGV